MFREGDMVWCFLRGWGTIVLIDDSSCYPINVSFEKNNRIYCYSREGELLANDAFQRTLFFDEFVVPKSALERPKWRARINHTYYYINSDGNIASDIDNGLYLDDARFKVGNYFKTSEEARQSKFYKVFHEEE